MIHRALRSTGEVESSSGCESTRKTRSAFRRAGAYAAGLILFGAMPICAQQREADEAWSQGRYDAARVAYGRVLVRDPWSARANLRVGIILSWNGKLDSALTLIARARTADPTDVEARLAQARVMAWNKQFTGAIARYDSLLHDRPGFRDATLGRAQTLAWAGGLAEAGAVYDGMIAKDSADREALLGQALVSAWQGHFFEAERRYRAMLARYPRDADALAGLGYVYYWQGRERAAGRQARAALAVDSMHKAGRALSRTVREATRSSLETTGSWSNDSDHNTSFWQTLATASPLGQGVTAFGSVSALETSDPIRDATRVGGEAGLVVARGKVQLSGAGGARRLMPAVAEPRTAVTYRGRLSYRPIPRFGLGVSYSRVPFDEIASLIERDLDLKLLEVGFDAKPLRTLTFFGSGSGLWVTDGNTRTGVLAGLSQRIHRKFTVGLFGRTLSYDRRGVGYFSPDRFSVLEANAGYSHETTRWIGSLSGGLGAQQIGERGEAQSEWHLEGRVGRRWGTGNHIELFGLVTNSAVSSTSGAFRYRSAGLTVRLGL